MKEVVGAVADGDYDLDSCEMLEEQVAEIHIYPNGFPYGGVLPFAVLVEAFGLSLLGVNEVGKYQSWEELPDQQGTA